eukprot:gene9506-6810_t
MRKGILPQAKSADDAEVPSDFWIESEIQDMLLEWYSHVDFMFQERVKREFDDRIVSMKIAELDLALCVTSWQTCSVEATRLGLRSSSTEVNVEQAAMNLYPRMRLTEDEHSSKRTPTHSNLANLLTQGPRPATQEEEMN